MEADSLALPYNKYGQWGEDGWEEYDDMDEVEYDPWEEGESRWELEDGR